MSFRDTSQPGPIFEMIVNPTVDDSSVVSASPRRGDTFDWDGHKEEGQLAVDVAENRHDVIVISTLAGALTEKLEVFVHNDLLTIRGERQAPHHHDGLHYFYQECFWGKFSRTIVLPVDVKGDLAEAEYKNGILIVRIPKARTEKKIPILIVEE